MNVKWAAIVVAIVVVVAAAAGFGGYTMGKNAGQAQALTARSAFLTARGAGGTGGTGGAGGGRNIDPNTFASGQVKSISGDTVQLSTATDVLTVKLSSQTQIQKQATGAVSDIQPGERLTIQGTRAADGTFTAETVQIGRSGGGPGAAAANGSNATATP
jgi:Domain of unknown function (DUF5666)